MACILIVDDEPDIRYALARVLDSVGHDVVEASTMRDAEAALSQCGYDVVICDLQLRDLSLVDFIDLAHLNNGDVSVVLVAGEGLSNSVSEIAEARARGVSGILRKPFDTDVLIDLVDRLTGANRMFLTGNCANSKHV